MTFNDDREEDDYSVNMIRVVLRDDSEVTQSFAMSSSAVALKADGFPDETNPVILDGGCTNIMFNHQGHFVDSG